MIAVKTQEMVWVSPNKMGNILGANHSPISFPTAMKAKEAPSPWMKFERANKGRLPEAVRVKFPKASRKRPPLATNRIGKRSNKYPAGICIQAKPSTKEPTANADPISESLSDSLKAPAKTAPAVLRKNA